jgi:hypothetical protein
LLNYCFGHRNSTLLLCPYGATSGLINHSKEKVNARVVWSTKATQRNEWFDQDVSLWAEDATAGLAFDYVATRNIELGEEVFIDYGDEWEAAWQNHVATWKPAMDADSYRPAYELDNDSALIIPTVREGSFDNEDHVKLMCREAYRAMRGLPTSDDVDDESGVLDGVLDCRAIERWQDESGEYVYNAVLFKEIEEKYSKQCFYEDQEILFAVPRDAFAFEDAIYSRDHAQPLSFRHDIRIPDDIMPKAWLNEPMGHTGG